ncbi:hypothetical protein PHYPSEUDO_001886 [Phytophthora pseudosyringae]|uniref:Temptin Cys/Cys disulfide domain-containing protein n=1 Tax=Phytophthora pseudosyringae TaxID=221518 RepID=A0A8T1WJR6_9STRA|nr:hypothetical protein PHYPSEUDO_001886 [Phytophthora pseudosyringae]
MSHATLSLALVATAAAVVNARPAYVARLPNGDDVSSVVALGHGDAAGGGANNDFGLDFASADQRPGAGRPVLRVRARPKRCCRWSDGVWHPGDVSSTSDESVWADITCGSELDERARRWAPLSGLWRLVQPLRLLLRATRRRTPLSAIASSGSSAASGLFM